MGPKFGTSGLRGLVTDLTPALCAAYTEAFLSHAATGGTLLIGRDLRSSSPDIAGWVSGAAARAGVTPLDCGVLPTPALAQGAMDRGAPAVMVTGSHIPDDRNGLKFYLPSGEISKDDEAAITRAIDLTDATAPPNVTVKDDPSVISRYVARYTDFFAQDALRGLRIGVFEHSSAARDILGPILQALGAEPLALGRADHFIPVDTEALDPEMRAMLTTWASDHGLDAIVSTDGDADRPMVADAMGQIVPGDVLGPLTARALGAEVVVTPVSSNSLVDALPDLRVVRTRIGSPYVIAGMAGAGPARVVGYEANGGFLTGFDVQIGDRTLNALPTRDAILPIVAPLASAWAKGASLAETVSGLPRIFTATDRLTGIETALSQRLVAALPDDPDLASQVFDGCGSAVATDRTDGHRVQFDSGLTMHLRPSGNAPELRIYVEADAPERAQSALDSALQRVAGIIARL